MEILVIITSSALVVFLLLAIASLIAFLVVLKRISALIHRAEGAAKAFEELGEAAKHLAQTASFTGLLGSVVRHFVKRNKKEN